MHDPRTPGTDHLARALDAALRQLTHRLKALASALASSRLAFASARPSTLATTVHAHGVLADAVHECELEVAGRRAALCAALGEPATARMSRLLPKLSPATARSLADAAADLRRSLHSLRVEGAVGQRLLDVTRRAQDGLLHALGANARSGQRYDRNARSVTSIPSGEIVRGTL